MYDYWLSGLPIKGYFTLNYLSTGFLCLGDKFECQRRDEYRGSR